MAPCVHLSPGPLPILRSRAKGQSVHRIFAQASGLLMCAGGLRRQRRFLPVDDQPWYSPLRRRVLHVHERRALHPLARCFLHNLPFREANQSLSLDIDSSSGRNSPAWPASGHRLPQSLPSRFSCARQVQLSIGLDLRQVSGSESVLHQTYTEEELAARG